MIKRGRKSQTTIFIVMAIIIVTAIILVVFLKTSNTKEKLGRDYFKERGLQPSVNNIQNFIVDCFEETSLDALELIGVQGGYHKKPELFYDLKWAFIPYYFYQGQYLKPSNEQVETQLSNYVDEALEFCLNKISFSNFQLTYPQPITKSSIQKDKVTFTTELLTSINNKEQTTTFELTDFPIEVNSSLYDILEIAEYITESHKENENFICINCLTELTKEKNLYIDFIAFEEDSTLIMLLENSSQPDPYIFQFLNKYDLTKIEL